VFASHADELTSTINGYMAFLNASKFSVRILIGTQRNRESVKLELMEGDGAAWRGVELASGGQKKIISLAIALAMQSVRKTRLALLLFDEATENLDSHASSLAMDTIHRASRNKVTLFVTHDSSCVPSGALTIKAQRNSGVVSIS